MNSALKAWRVFSQALSRRKSCTCDFAIREIEVTVSIRASRWWCDPWKCHLHPRIGSIGPDKPAQIGLYVPVWVFVGATWRKLRDIPTLPPSFPTLWRQYSAPFTSLVVILRWADRDALHFVVWELCMAARNVACLVRRCRHFWNAPPSASLLISTGLRERSGSVEECHWVQLIPHGWIQLHTLASCRRHFVRLPLCCQLLHGNNI